MPNLLSFGNNTQINYFSAVLISSVIIYGVLFYNRTAARTSHWQAMLVQIMLMATAITSLVETTGRINSIFVMYWLIMTLMSGVFGFFGTIGTAFFTVIYFVLNMTDGDGNPGYEPHHFIWLGVILAGSIASQLIWRRQYVNAETEQVAALSGQLRVNQKQSEILVQSLTDGVLLIDTSGVITLMNPAAAGMTGWPVDEGTGSDSKLVVIFKKEDGSEIEATNNPLTSILDRTQSDTVTLQLVNRNKSTIISSVVTSPILNPKTQDVIGGVIVIRDISATHQSDKQRAEFISTASHEMRTPVAAIEGYLQLALNEKVAKIDPKARDFLTKALDSTHHLGELFQDLLTSAKAEDGRLVSHPEVVELGAYVEVLADSFKFSAEKKGLLTDFVFGKSKTDGEHILKPLYFVLVDPDRLREVVTNLFDNAVKYTPTGKVSLGLTGNADVVQMFVKDTGPGIAAEDISHLFQKFYRVDNSSTRTIGGTGLGLFISKKIIEMYNGRIWAESELGKGSTFYINLPRISSQQAQEYQTKAAQGAPLPISSLTTPV